jgi:excisionase family DNA binding protein
MKTKSNRSKPNPDRSMTLTEPLWTVEDVAGYLRLKEETVRIMARSNKIPGLKIGKAWRFRASEIKEMLGEKGEQ